MTTLESVIAYLAAQNTTNEIHVIGKGASIDRLDLRLAPGNLVINLNDSERIVAGDVAIFHRPWVLDSLTRHGMHCRYYLTDLDGLPSRPTWAQLPYVPDTPETRDLCSYRFLQPGLAVEEPLFVTALKLAYLIGEHKRACQRVYMLGFDFAASSPLYSSRIAADFSQDGQEFKETVIRGQEYHLIEIMHLVQEQPTRWIDILHVGSRAYSRYNVEQFNCQMRHAALGRTIVASASTTMPLDAAVPQPDSGILIVAEMTNNHLGDVNRLRAMVRLASQAGADLVKVQKRDVGTFYTSAQLRSAYNSPFGTTLGDYRRGVELTADHFDALEEECRIAGIDWFASVLDWPSYLFLKPYGKTLLKLPSTISERLDFHLRVADAYEGPLVVSTGYSDEAYERFLVSTFEANERLYLLQTTSTYPTPAFECGISVVRHYRDLARGTPRITPGYSSHDIGSLGSMLAVAAGAGMLEKHVKLGNTPWVHFDHVALDLATGAFRDYVRDIRMAEGMCGSEDKRIRRSEHHKYPALTGSVA